MDTPTALITLETLSQNLDAQINAVSQQKAAVDIAIAQLKGLLDTPALDLAQAQATIAVLQEQATDFETKLDTALEPATADTTPVPTPVSEDTPVL